MGGVEPAGDSDHELLDAGRLEPGLKAGDLYPVDLVAALVAGTTIGGDVGEARDCATQANRAGCRGCVCGRARWRALRSQQAHADAAHLRQTLALVVDRVSPGARLGAVGDEPIEVDVGGDQAVVLRVALGLSELIAVLIDQRLTVPGEVGSRLARPGGRVYVGAQRARRMAGAELAPILGLADKNVAGRQVGQHRRAGQSGVGARRNRRPDVLADLDVNRQVREIDGGEQQIGSERGRRAVDLDVRVDHVASRPKLALLVELAVLGQIALGHRAEDAATMDHHCGVEQTLLSAQRRPDDRHRVELLGGLTDLLDGIERGVEQRVLSEQILARVGGEAQLREHDQRRVLSVCRLRERDRALGVEGRVGDPHTRNRSGDPRVSVAIDRVKRQIPDVPA